MKSNLELLTPCSNKTTSAFTRSNMTSTRILLKKWLSNIVGSLKLSDGYRHNTIMLLVSE
uniref:Uncharacterized protein n=1 Tax=Arundo donax TaxID=35708 RepID=A0A0A8Z2I9_ARUDO